MSNLRQLPNRCNEAAADDFLPEDREPLPEDREPLPEVREPLPEDHEPLPEGPNYDPDHATRYSRPFPFAHQKLKVYQVALEMARCSRELADRVPRGYRPFADQLLRAAGHTVLLIGEGANRYTAGQKRQRYTEARGESGETAATAELLATLRLVPHAEAQHVEHLAGRVAAMLTRLIQRYS
jgi:four helix bundle protein